MRRLAAPAAVVLFAGLLAAHVLTAGPRPCDAQAAPAYDPGGPATTWPPGPHPAHVTRLPTSPPAVPLAKLADGDVFELATGGLWVRVSVSPPRAPYQGATSGGPPIPAAGSRPEGWPEVPPAPAGWVYVVELPSGRLTLLPLTWQAWPVADWKPTARTTH